MGLSLFVMEDRGGDQLLDRLMKEGARFRDAPEDC